MKKQIERNCLSTLPIQTKQGEKSIFARFQLKDFKTNEYFQCIAFNNTAELLAKEIDKPNINILIKGVHDDDTFKVNSFKIKKVESDIDSVDINIKIAGSQEKLDDLKKRTKEQKERENQVQVKWGSYKGWFDREDCIQINGKWWHKVEFIIEQLGSEYVNRRYQEFVGDVKSLVTKGFSQKDYDNFKETLLLEAKGEKAMEEPRSIKKNIEPCETIKLEDGTEVEIL